MSEPFAAILVAAGRSTRMGIDKLWIDIYGRPVWRWGLDALLATEGVLVVAIAVPEDAQDRFAAAIPEAARERCIIFAGGAERADSVIKGVWALTGAGHDDDRLVLVHDAARPAVTTELISRVAEAATGGGSAIPVVPVPDSLKRIRADRVAGTIEREEVVAAQTPQAATLGALRAAIEEVYTWGRPITDDAGALAAAGRSVRVVPGDPANVKLTGPEDLDALRGILAARAVPVSRSAPLDDVIRTGIGFDAHRFEDGRPLRLGGVAFPEGARGLAGHSDGDAALHAVIDALLGAAGLGDVGSLFPPDDPTWAGADSADLLLRTTERLWATGVRPAWIDLAVVAAEPKLAPRRDEMAERIAMLTGLPVGAVTVKGTTSDALGFGGREGIAAWAVAGIRPTA